MGLYADELELRRVREAVASAGGTIVADRERALILDDVLGIRWEFDTFDYADPPRMSAGARLGRWLDVN